MQLDIAEILAGDRTEDVQLQKAIVALNREKEAKIKNKEYSSDEEYYPTENAIFFLDRGLAYRIEIPLEIYFGF
jgi:hypothetical protein